MSLVLMIALAVVAGLILATVALRVRKLRRDEMRKIAARVERHLMEPPPSPYTPSRGFRLLDGPVGTSSRPQPPRPRLEPDREYVFSESQLPSYQESVSPLGRHDERWALSKSVQRSRFSGAGARVGVVALVVTLVAIIALYYLRNGGLSTPPATTTTTSTLSTQSKQSDSKVIWPVSLVATSVSGENASYGVPVARYRVTVSGTNGAVWTVYQMGPQSTLEWQGRVAQGATESLVLTGSSRITLGSPRSATVQVGPSAVKFPSPLPPTLTLILTPPANASG